MTDADAPRLSVAAAAALLGCTATTIYRLVASRALRHYRPGGPRGRIRFAEADLRAYLAACCVEAGEPRARHRGMPPSRYFDAAGRFRRGGTA